MVSPYQHLLNPFLFASSRYHGSPLATKAKLFFIWVYVRAVHGMILVAMSTNGLWSSFGDTMA